MFAPAMLKSFRRLCNGGLMWWVQTTPLHGAATPLDARFLHHQQQILLEQQRQLLQQQRELHAARQQQVRVPGPRPATATSPPAPSVPYHIRVIM